MKLVREGVIEVNGKEYQIDQVHCGECDLVVSEHCDLQKCTELVGANKGLKEII